MKAKAYTLLLTMLLGIALLSACSTTPSQDSIKGGGRPRVPVQVDRKLPGRQLEVEKQDPITIEGNELSLGEPIQDIDKWDNSELSYKVTNYQVYDSIDYDKFDQKDFNPAAGYFLGKDSQLKEGMSFVVVDVDVTVVKPPDEDKDFEKGFYLLTMLNLAEKVDSTDIRFVEPLSISLDKTENIYFAEGVKRFGRVHIPVGETAHLSIGYTIEKTSGEGDQLYLSANLGSSQFRFIHLSKSE